MQREKKNLLTPNEVTFLLIGIMINISSANLVNKVIGTAKQDGWISVLIAAIYPLYIVLIAVYVSKKFPKDNILVLSKRYLGNILGTILNFLFLLSFFSYLPPLILELGVVIRTYIVPGLTVLQIYVVIFLLGAYAASKGIKVLGRISFIIFWMILAIFLPPVSILKDGSYLNISPIFGIGIVNILKGSLTCVNDYSLIVLIFLIYPFINDRSKIKNSSLKAVGITAIIYTWATFITIYYVGIDIIPKTNWGFWRVSDAVKVEIVNNFRYINMYFWAIIVIKTVAIINYVCMYILQDIKKMNNKKMIYVIMAVVAIMIAKTYYVDMDAMNQIIKYTSPISIIYNLIYITLIASLIWIRKEGIK